MFTFLIPIKLCILLSQFCHRSSNLGEVLHKSAIVSRQSQKTANLRNGSRRRPLNHCSNLLWVNSNTGSSNNMPKKSDFRQPKLALAELGKQSMIS
ncbi:hypothetical protein Syun_029406 [Stephania yunnanensis]|uniref:Secreted protein n=1 Tax=Stephania yunnanensis TaxID=152371 RepID=A0AAP0HJF3_9MAGN